MFTTLIIARHGNTFEKDQIPTRVGAKTDLPLVASGVEQAKKLGDYLLTQKLIPQSVFASRLQRTQQTAQHALAQMGLNLPITIDAMFDEIDYGVDENKPEAEVIARLGQQALDDWDSKAIVPKGWLLDVPQKIAQWQNFAQDILAHKAGQTTLVVTSNGVARFAPHILPSFDGFAAQHNIKLSTGACGVFVHNGQQWQVKAWNVRG